MRTVGLLPHHEKSEAMAAAKELVGILDRFGFVPRLDMDVAADLGFPRYGVAADAFTAGLDLAVALGGDGALLRAAQRVYPHQVPLFGVNFGHLGFLAEVEAAHLPAAVDRLQAGDYRLEDRLMVSAQCQRNGVSVVGLNDAVIAKGGRARMVALEIVLNGTQLTDYRADGLIVATPTGSTAYSLSAGGPILHPGVSALVVTAVCAHSLHAWPLVVGANDRISVKVSSAAGGELMLVADGQDAIELAQGDTIVFCRAPAATRLVRFRGSGFYDVLRQRFAEGKI